MTERKNVLRPILFLLPFLIGTAGFLQAGMRPLDSLFSALTTYTLNFQDTPPNVLVEFSRWTAPIATASGVLLAFSALKTRLHQYLIYRRGGSIAVYGEPLARKKFLSETGGRGLEGQDRFLRADSYVLLREEEENFAFFRRYKEKLQNRAVYLRCSSLHPQENQEPFLRLFSPEETAARMFWRQHCLYEEFKSSEGPMHILLLGFGKLGEEVLRYALLDNIFSPSQEIVYHVFGDAAEFTAVHHELDHIGDKVILHENAWWEEPELLNSAARILVLSQEDQLYLVNQLLLFGIRCPVFVFARNEDAFRLLSRSALLHVFSWMDTGLLPENVLSDQLYRSAMDLNLSYAALYNGTPKTEENRKAEWEKLDGFTRYSNISAADYHEIRKIMLAADGLPQDPAALPADTLEWLSELEHIRWCRYHYLQNWRHGIPETGKRKDASARIHSDLVPYENLTEGEKKKDRDNIRFLLKMDSE